MNDITIEMSPVSIRLDFSGPGGALAKLYSDRALQAASEAEASAADAQDSEDEAENAADDAELSADAAEVFANAAGTSASSAAVSRGGAETALAAVLAAIDDEEITVPLLVPAASRAIMAASATLIPIYLYETGREGIFIWDSSNLSAQVTADPLQGLYVPPTTDTDGSSGAWVRERRPWIFPEWFGYLGDNATIDTLPFQAACTWAGIWGARVELRGPTMGLIDSEIIVPENVNIVGPRNAVLKLHDQVATTTTAAITSGTGAKSFTVTSTTGLAVGQSVMLATTTTISPNDAYSHAGRHISTIVGSTVTIAAGPSVQAHASGAVFATTSHLLRLQGDNVLEGFTVDGNEANQTYAHWITSSLIAQEGDNVRFRGIRVQNTPSDGILCGGPSAGEIAGSWLTDSEFENIGGNGIHYGNARDLHVTGNTMTDGNMRMLDAQNQGGGAPDNRSGHQDGAVAISDNVIDLTVSGNTIENWICGVGGLSTVADNLNDHVTVDDNTIINCFRPFEAILGCRHQSFTNNRCRAVIPFASGGNRWDSHTVYFHTGAIFDWRIQNIVCSGNTIKNGNISTERPLGGAIIGNVIDNREMNDAIYVGTPISYGILLYSYEGLTVTGNTIMGGFIGIYMQNSYDAGDKLCRDTVIADNTILDPYHWGIVGTLSGTGTLAGTVVRNNIIRGDTDATQEDGSTALDFDTTWIAIGILEGLQVEGNTINYNVSGGAAWSNGNDAAYYSRRGNKVNGLYELPQEWADDAAASAALPVGGMYKTGSLLKVRAA